MRLKDRTAIVTGAASGIGRAIARRFAQEGAVVVVSDIREEPVNGGTPTHSLIEQEGGKAVFVQADASSWADIDHLVGSTVEKFGRLDIMVTNAARFESHSIMETTEEEWDRVMALNLRGTFLCCKRAIAQMLEQPETDDVRGRIIIISSQHGMVGPPEYFTYAVSKGGLINMTHQLAVDYARQGIIVNAVAPGRIITGTHPGEENPDEDSPSQRGLGDPGLAYSRSRTPFSRLGRAEDVAGAALFLASEDATYVSGINLLVDGGWMAY